MRLEQMVDDGLLTPEIGPWGIEKAEVVQYYADIFTTAMRDKFDELIYIDLFAGAGFSRVRESGEIVPGSPLIALGLRHPFSKLVFCEKVQAKAEALRERTRRLHPDAKAAIIAEDCHSNVERIVDVASEGVSTERRLTFCLVDPFNLSSLRLSTLAQLQNPMGRVDFIVLLPLGIDAVRNEKRYVAEDSDVIEHLLDNERWRAEYAVAVRKSVPFAKYLVDAFSRRLSLLGYLPPTDDELKQVKWQEKNLPLYHLAFYSKHPLGRRFWNEARRRAPRQTELF